MYISKMTLTEANKKAIKKYRDENREKINELHRKYALDYYNRNSELCIKRKLDLYYWKKENTFEGISKTFRKILIKGV